jgi:hypothetical protein
MKTLLRSLLLSALALGAVATSPLALADSLPSEPEAVADATPYKAGDTVSVQWKGTWYKCSVLEVKDDKFKIHYEGWGSEWDEWVGTDRMRAFAGYKVGDLISVEWKGTWYKSTVLEVKGETYKIHYEGWGSEWDEWVSPARIRNLAK